MKIIYKNGHAKNKLKEIEFFKSGVCINCGSNNVDYNCEGGEEHTVEDIGSCRDCGTEEVSTYALQKVEVYNWIDDHEYEGTGTVRKMKEIWED